MELQGEFGDAAREYRFRRLARISQVLLEGMSVEEGLCHDSRKDRVRDHSKLWCTASFSREGFRLKKESSGDYWQPNGLK